jgi:hypothetical protein
MTGVALVVVARALRILASVVWAGFIIVIAAAAIAAKALISAKSKLLH